MKFILCSVFLAHGAVFYTVCTIPRLCQIPHQNGLNSLDICVIPKREVGFSPHHKKNRRIQPGQHKYRDSCCAATSLKDGWQMSGDLSFNTPYDITIHFTIDTRGCIKSIRVAPFTSTLYQMVYDQLKQIRFTWQGSSFPPAYTMFEKKIRVR